MPVRPGEGNISERDEIDRGLEEEPFSPQSHRDTGEFLGFSLWLCVSVVDLPAAWRGMARNLY